MGAAGTDGLARMGRIDDLDMRILGELTKDASLSVPRLSKKLGINSSVAYSRIKRLLRRNLIRRYTVEVNEEMLGYVVTAIIGVNIDSKLRESILDEILDLDELRDLSEVTGRFDLVLTVRARSLDELHEIVSGKIGRISGVLHTETFIQMKKRTRDTRYLLQKAR